jgi:hypothetical protein
MAAGCQPYAPTALYSPLPLKHFFFLIPLLGAYPDWKDQVN